MASGFELTGKTDLKFTEALYRVRIDYVLSLCLWNLEWSGFHLFTHLLTFSFTTIVHTSFVVILLCVGATRCFPI